MNERMINQWLTKNAQEYTEDMEDGEIWYADCDIVDAIIDDLDIEDTDKNRNKIARMLEIWIVNH